MGSDSPSKPLAQDKSRPTRRNEESSGSGGAGSSRGGAAGGSGSGSRSILPLSRGIDEENDERGNGRQRSGREGSGNRGGDHDDDFDDEDDGEQDEQEEEDDEEEEEPLSFFVRALYDFTSTDSSSLSFRKGALIEVLTQLESGWWDGLLGNDVRGWFPSNYVEVISDEEAERELRGRADIYLDQSLGEEPTTPASLEAPWSSASSAASRSGKGATRGASASADYGGMGLGRELDPLRALMSGEGMHSNDAFEELAEVAMSRRNRLSGNSEEEAEREGGVAQDDDDNASTSTIEERRGIARVPSTSERPRGMSLPQGSASTRVQARQRAGTTAGVTPVSTRHG